MKLRHVALLALCMLVVSVAVPSVLAQPSTLPMTFQSPIQPPIEPPVPDLGGLVVGSVSFAPLIWGLVTLAKKLAESAGKPLSRDVLLGLVIVLASAAYGIVKLAEVNPSIVPVVESLVNIGLLLLGILLPAGGAVLIHRAQREASKPSYDRS